MITHPKNVFYYTGFNSAPHERFLGLFWHAERGWTIVLPKLDELAAASVVDQEITLIGYKDEESVKAVIQAHIPVAEVLYIEENVVTYDRIKWFIEQK